MGSSGKALYEKFNGEVVEIFCNIDAEWLQMAEITAYNHFTIVAMVAGYDEENDIVKLNNSDGQSFYLSSDQINIFWLYNPAFNILKSFKKVIDGGVVYSFNRKNNKTTDSKFQKHLEELKKPKV